MQHIKKETVKTYITPITYIKKNIPKIIFRTHPTKNISVLMNKECFQEWIRLNPSYSMYLFDNDNVAFFISKMGDRVKNAFNKLKPGAFKADLFRALILYEYGGVYVDSYATPLCSIDTMIKGCVKNFISVKDVDHIHIDNSEISGVHNGFIICKKRHPFIRQYISDILNNIENNYYGDHFLDPTGPFCLMRAINKVNGNVINKKPKVGLNKGLFSFYLFKFHLIDIYCRVSKNGIYIMKKKYSPLSLFYEKIIKRKNVYSIMWKNRDIYINN